MTKKIIFITGMHRCGTSLLSNCIIQNNFSIGKNKNRDKDWQNPNGYFENDSFTKIHDELLKYNNSDWLNIKRNEMKYTKEHIFKYNKLINTEFENDNNILIKDPRLSFFINFINELCNSYNYEYYIIFLIRDKNECCKSLSKAQNKSMDKCFKLYDITIKNIKENVLVINHKDIIFNNETVLKNISKYCNFNIMKNTTDLVDLKLYRNKK